jgi:hypothetical protein
MRRIKAGIAAAGIAGLVAGAAGAQQFDAGFGYTARDEITKPGTTEELDNDIARLALGLTWGAGGDGRMRGALELGFANNDDWSGDLTGNYGVELVFARKVGNQRYGLGGRFRDDAELTSTTEIAYSIEHLGESLDLRGLVGLQMLADADRVPGRDDNTLFAQGEVTIYPTSALALSAAVLADGDGEGYGVGVEYRPAGWGVSFYLDYAEAFDDYRDVASYDAFAGGIRFVPGTSSLKAQRQGGLGRIMHRYFEAQ